MICIIQTAKIHVCLCVLYNNNKHYTTVSYIVTYKSVIKWWFVKKLSAVEEAEAGTVTTVYCVIKIAMLLDF